MTLVMHSECGGPALISVSLCIILRIAAESGFKENTLPSDAAHEREAGDDATLKLSLYPFGRDQFAGDRRRYLAYRQYGSARRED